MKNTATTPTNSDHSGPAKMSANPSDATSASSGATPANSTSGTNSTTTPPLTSSTPKPATSAGTKTNATNGSSNNVNNNSSGVNPPDTKSPSSTSASNVSSTGVTGGSKPANTNSQGATPPATSSRPAPPSRAPPSTPTTPPLTSPVTTTITAAVAATTTTTADNKEKKNPQADSGVRKSLIERFSFLSRSKESNLDSSGTGSNTGPSAQVKTGVTPEKAQGEADEAKKEKEKKEKEEKEEKKRKKEEEKRKKEEEKKRKKEEEQERKKREKEEKEKSSEGLESTPGEEAVNGGWEKKNKSKVMEAEACKKVKSSDPNPNATTVVQWSPGSFRPRAMRSGVYIVNDPRSNRGDANSPTYNGNCPQVQLKKMAGDSVNVDMDDTLERSGNIYRSALTKLVCCLYALIIIALGVVFSTADALTAQEREHKYYLEIFLIYLYVMSLAILLYFHVHLLRGMRNTYFEKNLRITIRRSQDNLHKSISTEPTSDDNEEQVTALSDTPTKTCNPDQVSTSSHASSQSHLELPAEGTAAHVGEGINFYLRLGCLAFSLGSVALDGFHIATYFETESTATCESPIFPMVYVVHLLFVFVQTFFVFKNHKLVINKSKALVRFGLMHLLATNLCIWSSTAIAETAKDYRQQEFFKSHEHTAKAAQGVKSVTNTTKSCFEDVTLARVASPYLFPCTIMYSLIASGIIHRMYLYVGVKVKQKWPSHMSLTSSQPQSTASMDCEKANRGLFLGLLIGVITLIAIATFFVFEVRISDSETAIKVFFITEIALLVITTIGVILGYLRLSTLRFRSSRMISLDSILLIIALSGTYVYLFLLLISSASGFEEFGLVAILSVICICMELVQLSVQAVFLLDGLCRSIKYEEQQTRKPGRAIVTFLLVCNLALWSVSSFEVKKTTVVPLHEKFFGLLAWNIIIHLCLPLLIFIRFHSVICLSEIWYDAYQKDKDH